MRKILGLALLGLWTLLVVPIAQAPATKLAEKLGLDRYYAEGWESAVARLTDLAQNLWFIFLVGIVTGAAALFWMDYFWRRYRKLPEQFPYVEDESKYSPLEIVAGKEFRNEQIVLDSKRYMNCKFINVSFVYNGTTPVQFDHNVIVGGPWLKSDNRAVTNAWALLKGMGFILDEAVLNVLPTSLVSAPEKIGKRPIAYLPGDAQALTNLLRGFRDRLSAATADSTSLSSYFLHWDDRYNSHERAAVDFPGHALRRSSREAADEVAGKVAEVQALVKACGDAIPNFNSYNAYRDDWEPLTSGIWHDPTTRDIVDGYRALLNIIAQREDEPLTQSDVQAIREFNRKTASFLNEFCQKVLKRLHEIDAAMLRIRQAASL
jgi:hypothetical protein